MLTKDDFVIMTWNEYEAHIESLFMQIHNFLVDKEECIDVVIPILRGGCIPATSLAYKFNVFPMRGIQMKHDYEHHAIHLLLNDLPYMETPTASYTVLLVDGYHASGRTAYMAYDIIQQALPNVKIIYATLGRDIGYLKDLRDFYYSCHAFVSNECGIISKKISASENILTKYTLFPWENIDDELKNMNAELLYGV